MWTLLKHGAIEGAIMVAIVCLSIVIVFVFWGCGQGYEKEEFTPQWCYLKTADWLINMDPEFKLYKRVKGEWPPEGLITDAFRNYNTDQSREINFHPPGEWTRDEVSLWVSAGYSIGIQYCVLTDGNGVKRYHADPMTDIAQLDGKSELSVFVSGRF